VGRKVRGDGEAEAKRVMTLARPLLVVQERL
jgi:hypothetical protein